MIGWKRLIPLLLCAALLSGCAAGGEETGPVTVTVWTYYNGAQLTAFNALVEEFNQTEGKEKGIVVESYSHGSVNDLETNVLAAAQGKAGAGEVPDIFAAYADTAYSLDQMGIVADLTPYFTQTERDAFVDSYLQEGEFEAGSLKIIPVAKSIELFLLNKTDWDKFAQATGASYEDFSTLEGVTATARAYYEWTDGLTPEPNDGQAFFGRDAMANYFLIGAKQLGVEIFTVRDGKLELHFDHDVMRRLWDNYYVPYVKGYFSASGRFRSDDIKTGNIIALVGSSSGATFFPDHVIVGDNEEYPIEVEVFPAPGFADGEACAVQQGAGMAVTAGEERQVAAAVEFLKWFTQDARNIVFSVESGYLPVTKSANRIEAILSADMAVTPVMERILTAAVDTVQTAALYTPRAFETGTSARAVLEYSMSDLAAADRAVVEHRLGEGMSLEEAAAEFLTDEYFEAWYADARSQLEALEG